MRVYFTASIVGKKYHLNNYLKIVEYLKAKGYEVISDHIINTTEAKIRIESKEERLNFQNKLKDWIKSCDLMIAETSFPSISVGYEISLGLEFGKPVLILYSEGDPPSLLAHHKDENLVCEKYTATNVQDIINDFINYAEASVDTRFTFFITPNIASYLERISRKEKLPKSVYLRKLIEKDMQKRS